MELAHDWLAKAYATPEGESSSSFPGGKGTGRVLQEEWGDLEKLFRDFVREIPMPVAKYCASVIEATPECRTVNETADH